MTLTRMMNPMNDFVPNFLRTDGELIAQFGQARLVKTPEGKFELRGGSAEDRRVAHEWISLFMHEVVVCK
jgi:hypothetical protein